MKKKTKIFYHSENIHSEQRQMMQNLVTDFFRNRMISAKLKYSCGLNRADTGQIFSLQIFKLKLL